MSAEGIVLTTHRILSLFSRSSLWVSPHSPLLRLGTLDLLLITIDVALKRRGGLRPLPFLPGVVRPCRSISCAAFVAPLGPAVDTRQALSEAASSSGMAGNLGRGKSRMDKRCQGWSFYRGQPYSKFGITSGDLTFHSVFGQSSTQGICGPVSEPRELYRGRPIGQEQFHVRWCVRSSSSCFSWRSHDPKILFRLHFYPYGSQSVGAPR